VPIKSPGGGSNPSLGSLDRNSKYLENFTFSKLVSQFLPDNPVVLFDIGARYGESTNWYAQHFSLRHVELFEPNPFIEQSLDTPNCTTFKINRFGLSDTCSRKNFYIHKNVGMSSYEPLNSSSLDSLTYSEEAKINIASVDTKRLDCLTLPTPDIVKIDVQAHEEKVLRGGVKTLQSARVLLIETTLYDLYSQQVSIGTIESLLPNHELYSIPYISYNPRNFRTDWVELFFVRKDLRISSVEEAG